jgi:hypothetical protein
MPLTFPIQSREPTLRYFSKEPLQMENPSIFANIGVFGKNEQFWGFAYDRFEFKTITTKKAIGADKKENVFIPCGSIRLVMVSKDQNKNNFGGYLEVSFPKKSIPGSGR